MPLPLRKFDVRRAIAFTLIVASCGLCGVLSLWGDSLPRAARGEKSDAVRATPEPSHPSHSDASSRSTPFVEIAPPHADPRSDIAREPRERSDRSEPISILPAASPHEGLRTIDALAEHARVLWLKGQHEAASQCLLAAVQNFPKSAETRLSIARFFEEHGQIPEAIQFYREALNLDRSNITASACLAWLLATQRDAQPAEAIEAMRLAESACNETREAWLFDVLAASRARTGNFTEAIVAQRRAIELDTPREGPATDNQQRRLWAYEHRLRHYQALAPFLAEHGYEFDGELLLRLGRAELERGNVEGALRNFRRAVRRNATDVASLSALAWVLATYVDDPYRDGEQALRWAEWAVQSSGDRDSAALASLAAAQAELGKFDEAVVSLDRAAQLDYASLAPLDATKKSPATSADRARLDRLARYAQQRMCYESRQPFRDGSTADRLVHLALAELRDANASEAIQRFERALAADPNHLGAGNELAWLLATHHDERVRDADRAVQLAEKLAEKTERKHAWLLDTLAAAHASRGDFDRAAQVAREGIRLEEGAAASTDSAREYRLRSLHNRLALYQQRHPFFEPPRAADHVRRGVQLARQGNTETAIESFVTALKLDPNPLEAANELAWLYATHPDDQVRNGKEALRLALKAADASERRTPWILDTLAAAYAESGDLELALHTIDAAIQIESMPLRDAAAEASRRMRLEIYTARRLRFEAGQPIRETP